ncbi:MAG TPA: hypothetical protein VFU02_03530 [Polyangiaceae bacterium]|nr:hypothetical protein [Polyangiaceae bacterium]
MTIERIKALRSDLRRAAESDQEFEPAIDDDYYEALGTLAKEIAARGVVLVLPSIRVARPGGPARVPFRWPRPSRALVELESDRTGKVASAEYRIELDESGVLRHSDYRITKVMDAFIKEDPEKMLLAARAHAIAQKIPELVIDASGAATGPAELDEPLRQLMGIEPDPELVAFTPLLAKFWYAWCQSFLGLPVTGPGSRGVVRVVHDLLGGEQVENDAEFVCSKSPDLPGHWTVSLESKLLNPPKLALTRAVHRLLKDPELRLDELLAQPTELLVHLTVVVEPSTFRPVAASRLVGASVGNPDRPQGCEYESQVWTFDWQT